MSGSNGARNGGGEPDWGKFGLEKGERQPLRGGDTGGAGRDTGSSASGGGGGKEMFGGQIQHDSELFADDQGSRAPPWWLSSLLVGPEDRVLFGTWDGVFTSCLINIFGVIVFLRSGWVVAEAGLASAVAIVAAAVALILVAVFAAIGICERCHVRSGGVYFLISHVLGSRRGAAVGIIYVLGQAIGNALCATGFGESIAGLLAPDHSPLTERLVAALVIAFLTLVNAGGVKWVIRLQFALLVILLLGAADFVIGSLTHTDPDRGFYGWNASAWTANLRPNYTEHHNWFSVFGVFFPALTGVMAGINMSGDLRNPSQDISVGTLSAVGTGFFLYLMFMLVLAGTCDRGALLTDFMIAEKVSALGVLLLSALYISSISSCLATLYGTPRVLQSIAGENMIPALKKFAEGKGPNKVPVNALLLISAVTLFFIAVGEMNRLATLATMPFLITYGVIEYAYFALCMQFDMNQRRLARYRAHGIAQSPTFEQHRGRNGRSSRGNNQRQGSLDAPSVASDDSTASSIDSNNPVGKKGRDEEFEELLEKYNVDEIEEKPKNFYSHFCNRWISLAGFLVKLLLMFLIHWGYSLLCLLACFAIWFYIGKASPGVNPGIAAEFSIVKFAKNLTNNMSGRQEDPDEDQQLIINPIEPAMTTRPTHLNEVNSDFADRSQFHQTHTTVESAGARFK